MYVCIYFRRDPEL